MPAVIFDLDGVIVDTMDLHFEAGEKVLTSHGLKVTKEQLRKMDSTRVGEAYKKFMSSKSDKEIAKMVSKTNEYLVGKTKGIKPIPGFLEFFESVKGKYALGVVSSSSSDFVNYILNELGIRGDFSAVIGGDDVEKGKPDPQGYLKAAAILKQEAKKCLVIEDSIFGIRAAKDAGMNCIAVTNTYERVFLLDADLVVDSLAEISPKIVQGFLDA